MAKEYKILSPEAAVNMIVNPSFESGTTGWTAVGGSIAQSAAYQRRGVYSLAVTPSAGTSDGVSSPVMAFTSGTSYTFSADIRGVISIPYTVHFASTAAVVKGTPTDFTATGRWDRPSVTWACDAGGNYMIYIRKDADASTSLFYVDGALNWAGDHDTSYFDGDSVGFLEDGHYWTGTPHASTSTRLAAERSGGQEIDLATIGLTVSNPVGIGMPGIAHHVQGQALLPGAEYVGYKVMPRVIDLSSAITGSTSTEDATLEKRKDVIDLIKPDRVRGAQPFILRYYLPNGRGPVEYRLVYDSGGEYNSGSPVETPSIRCIGYDPFAYEDGQEGAAITTSLSVANADRAVRKNAGTWANISTDFGAEINGMVKGKDGLITIVGLFQNVGDANGDFMVQWNPTTATLSSMGTVPNAGIYGVAVAPNGYIYITGLFTDLGGANGDYIAYWDGAAFQPLSTGLVGATLGRCLVFGNDGTLYVGGNFTNFVDANGDYITKWNGTAFSSLGTGMDGIVYTLAVAPNGDIYAGGVFTTAGGTTVNGIAKWNGTAWSALSTGVAGATATVYAIAIDKNGLVYLGGDFDTAGGVTVNNIACWNGQKFIALGSGANDIVYGLTISDDGLLYAGGLFSTAGGIALNDLMAVWNGSSWAHIDINLQVGAYVLCFLSDRDNLYIGGSFFGTATASYLNTLTNNGSTGSYPVVKIKRSGGTSATLEWIKNETTGATLWCNYALLDGETLTMDFRPGRRSVTSDFFGNVLGRGFLRNSDFIAFNLLPGSNSVGVFVNTAGAPTITATAYWDILHWSADGVAA